MADPKPNLPISEAEFSRLRALVLARTGITLGDTKRMLMVSRLASRLKARGLTSFMEYYQLIMSEGEDDELQAFTDLITTNETSFFREADHFRVLRDYLARLRPVPFPFRVWSAASSTGEEAYTIAMVLADVLGSAEWEVCGTDISTRVLERARRGVYPMERSLAIPEELLRRFCLKGQGKHAGMFMIGKPLRDRVRFLHGNLCGFLPVSGPFDVVFLQNVLIYFDTEHKRRILETVIDKLEPSGLLLVGHSESLNGLTSRLTLLQPTVYRVS